MRKKAKTFREWFDNDWVHFVRRSGRIEGTVYLLVLLVLAMLGILIKGSL